MEAHAGLEEADRQVSAERSIALDQQSVGASSRGSDGRADARHASADHDDLGAMGDRKVAGRLMNEFHWAILPGAARNRLLMSLIMRYMNPVKRD
jgi:hypothetical protein